MILNALDDKNLSENIGCRVFLDGSEVDGVIYVDTDQGVVVHLMRNEEGRYFHVNGYVATSLRSGLVEIKWPTERNESA